MARLRCFDILRLSAEVDSLLYSNSLGALVAWNQVGLSREDVSLSLRIARASYYHPILATAAVLRQNKRYRTCAKCSNSGALQCLFFMPLMLLQNLISWGFQTTPSALHTRVAPDFTLRSGRTSITHHYRAIKSIRHPQRRMYS